MQSISLFSDSWYRVATLRPRLRSHAQIHRHVYRQAVWYVMQNHSTGKFHRFTPVANLVIGLMDGQRTLQDIWNIACARLGEAAPSQDEVIKLMSDLHAADALQGDASPDAREREERRLRHRRTKLKQYVGNPLSIRFPLVDPDRFLDRAMPFLRPLMGWPGTLLWLAVATSAAILVGMHWKELSSDVVDRVFTLENLLLAWVVFPLIKLLHELGHAVAIKAGGGEVHEMGVMLLVLVPIPYVDASAATAFRDKRSRMLVGAAGMLVELFLASLAVFVWINLEPGFTRAVIYNIILIAGITTILFNANPLLRFDGYYILADWIESPNLGQRANDYLGYLVRRYLFGVQGDASPAETDAERGWLAGYAVLSFFYRIGMMVSIAVLVATQFFFIGVVLALWAVASMLVIPIGKKIHYLFFNPRIAGKRPRALFVTGVMLAGIVGIVAWVPAPSSTRAEGVIWAPEQAHVRAAIDGVVGRVLVKPEQPVVAGQPLIECHDPELEARTRVLQAQLAELDARHQLARVSNRVQVELIDEQREHVREALRQARRRQAELLIRAPTSGVFVMQDPDNLPGRYVQRGELLAHVVDRTAKTVRVVVSAAEGAQVATRTRRVEIRPVERIGQPFEARIAREVPAATNELPSLALSLQGGGKIGLDPTKGDDGRALEKLFVLDLELPRGEQTNYLGGRIHVRFEHLPEPLATQWYRALRRAFLKQFNV
ncbi:MAG: efflux RND transporter periplasmic adaptor subunit [Proteobacteria bacterium]|nr:efflux RND transporter periplasmic adaptor subunit [Pseudomonadota bacterium]